MADSQDEQIRQLTPTPHGASAEPAESQIIAAALDRLYTLLGRQFGALSRPQRRMLRTIDGRAALRVSDLAESLSITSAGATRMLDTLAAQGYITRFRQPEADQRQVYVALTTAGSQALAEANAVYLARLGAAIARLPAADRAALASALPALAAALDQ